jgi:hypothetical protein
VSPSTNARAKHLPPRKWPVFRVLRSKPKKMEDEPQGRRVGAAAFIAQT